MESIKIKTLNELMSKDTRGKYKVSESKGYTGIADSDEGSQGEYNERFVFYKHEDLPENIFLQETIHTDSYGDNESTVEWKFVEGKAKTITVYEPLN